LGTRKSSAKTVIAKSAEVTYALGRRTFVLIITTLLRNGELYIKYG
jgi:hypothetical protein